MFSWENAGTPLISQNNFWGKKKKQKNKGREQLRVLMGGGGDGNWCPGTICNNSATDCQNIELDCAPGEQEACVGGSYFDADPNLRCTFCLKE